MDTTDKFVKPSLFLIKRQVKKTDEGVGDIALRIPKLWQYMKIDILSALLPVWQLPFIIFLTQVRYMLSFQSQLDDAVNETRSAKNNKILRAM
jgi:hypothetical protein